MDIEGLLKEKSDSLLTDSLNFASNQNPDEMGEISSLSRESGLSPDMVRHDKGKTKDVIRKKEIFESLESIMPEAHPQHGRDLIGMLKKNSPNLARYLSDPMNASVSIDDIEQLSQLDKALNATINPPKENSFVGDLIAGMYEWWAGESGTEETHKAMIQEHIHRSTDSGPIEYAFPDTPLGEAVKKKQEESQRVMEEGWKEQREAGIEQRIKIEGKASKYEQHPVMLELMEEEDPIKVLQIFMNNKAQIITSATARSAANMVPIMGSGFAGGAAAGPPGAMAGAGYASYDLEFTLAFDEALKEAGYNVYDADDLAKAAKDPEVMDLAMKKGAAKGLSVSLFDALGMGMLAGPTRASKALSPALQKVMSAITKVSFESATEAGGEATGLYSIAVLDGLDKGMEPMEALKHGFEVLEKSSGEVLAEAAGGLGATVVNVPGAWKASRKEAAERLEALEMKLNTSQSEQAILDQAITIAQDSKTRQRDKVVFQQAVEQIAPDDQRVFIPVDSLKQLDIESLQVQEKIDIAIEKQEEDLILPMDEFLSDVAPDQKLIEAIRPDIRLGLDSLNQEELSDEGALYEDILQETSDKITEDIEVKSVTQKIFDQLKQTKVYGEPESRKMTKTIEAAIRAKMDRKGLSAQEVADIGFGDLKVVSDLTAPDFALKQDFGDVNLTEGAMYEGTEVSVEIPATEAWNDVQKRKNVAQKLVDCL